METSAAQTQRINALLGAVVFLALVGASSTVLIAVLRPGMDNAVIYASLATFVGPTTATLLAFMIKDTHVLVNGQMAAFREELRQAAVGHVQAARADGLREGNLAGVASADARTDALHPPEGPSLGAIREATDTNDIVRRIEQAQKARP